MEIHVDEKLPPLAWLASIRENRTTALVGAAVQQFDRGIFDGGWAYCDSPADRRLDGVYLGAGLIQSPRGVTAICPSHPCDAIYAALRSGETLISNSLFFLFNACRIDKFDADELRDRMNTIKQGLKSFERTVLEREGLRIVRFVRVVAEIGAGEVFSEITQTNPVDFSDYITYRDFLSRTISDAAQTFKSAGTVVYLSAGYDSTACAALAKPLGGAVALSVDLARDGSPDSGAEIAERLGLNLIRLDRPERQRGTRPVPYSTYGGVEHYETIERHEIDGLADFFSGYSVGDESMKAPDHLVAGKAVLTGFHGDRVWAFHKPNDDFKRGDTSGNGLVEFRLRANFLHIPVPMIGASAHAQIRAISRSDEMRPWRLFNKYDRPFPRRMGEEVGLSREMFGQKKRAIYTMVENLSEVAPSLWEAVRRRYPGASQIPFASVHSPMC